MIVQRVGNKKGGSVWFGHGWGRDHNSFNEVVEALRGTAECVLLDFPGAGGKGERPAAAWGIDDYAGAVSELVGKEPEPVIWVGHSFGGRVGIALGSKFPANIAGMVLISAAGIPRQRNPLQRWRGKFRQAIFKFRRSRASGDDELRELEKQYGSPDYVQSGADGVRDIFLKIISEDQSDRLPQIRVPVKLLYGANDRDTPPEMGKRMNALIPNSELTLLENLDHSQILWRGRHIIALQIKELLEGARQ